VWLAGDNVSGSFDSRYYGCVSLGLVTGKVVRVLWWEGWWVSVHRVERMEKGEFESDF